jgi:anti-anti-sigma factor
VVVVLQGELDMATAPALAAELDQACNAHLASLLVDAASLSFCDSSGIALLTRTLKHCEESGIGFRIVGLRGIARKAFEVTGMLEVLDVDLEERTEGASPRSVEG